MQLHIYLTHFLLLLEYLKASVKLLGLPDSTHTFSNCAGGIISQNPLPGGALAVVFESSWTGLLSPDDTSGKSRCLVVTFGSAVR